MAEPAKRRPRGGVFKVDGKGGWWASVTTSCGSKRVRLKLGDTRPEADERYGELRRLKRLGQLTPERLDDFRANRRFKLSTPSGPTLADAWADFVAAKPGKRSLDADHERWAIVTTHLPETRPLAKLTAREVDEALEAAREARGVKQATRNRYAALLRSVLRLQKRRGVELGFDPSEVRTTKEAPRERVLEPAELTAFFGHLEATEATADGRTRGLRELAFAVRLALFTAARLGELGALTWGDIDLRGGALHFRETKAGGSRTVHLPPQAVELLEVWRAERGTPDKADRMLVTKDANISRRFAAEAEAAGILDARFHDLRRTACSRMLEAGVDARTVQRISGHRDLTVLLRVYNSVSERRRREAVDVLGRAFGGGS